MNTMPPKEARVRFRQSEVLVPLADHAIVAHHVVPPGVSPGIIQNRPGQEPVTRSLHLPYKPYEISFARIFLFLETVGLLDWRALYAIQYNIIQYDTAKHNLTQNNTIK